MAGEKAETMASRKLLVRGKIKGGGRKSTEVGPGCFVLEDWKRHGLWTRKRGGCSSRHFGKKRKGYEKAGTERGGGMTGLTKYLESSSKGGVQKGRGG